MSRLLVFIATLAAFGSEISLTEFATRRASLREALKDNVAVIHGKTDKEAEDDRNGFFQYPNYYYLTGLRDAGGVLVLTRETETLYLAKRDTSQEKWTGRRLSLDDDAAKITGISQIRSIDSLDNDLNKLKSKKRAEVPRLLALQRMKKSAAELAVMQKAIEASMAAHKASWAAAAPGKYEYQIAAKMTQTYFDLGCQRNAYAPIVGSGPNGVILHYSKNSRRMDAGEMLLMDVGAECDGYAADITRTVPVNGKFTPRQRDLYNAVLKAERAVIAAAKPGLTIKQLKQIAIDSLNSNGQKLGQYMTHGVSHHIGLEVHDLADNDVPLSAGTVITVEPGVYLPNESIGIRIEDMILITETGAKVLTAALPVEADAIERAMSSHTPSGQ